MRRLRRILPAGALALLLPGGADAQVFEVIHPDITPGGFELESLNGAILSDVSEGEERSAHEIALGYAPLDFWKITLALEIANPAGESAAYEAFEVESLLLLPLGHDHDDHDHGHRQDHGDIALRGLGLYLGLEVPNEGGLDAGALAVGPVAELGLGRVTLVGNLLVEIPFPDDEDASIAYAVSASHPVGDGFEFGVEAHGAFEGALGDSLPLEEQGHFLGPALYSGFDLGNGRVLEPRAALLFGLTESSPDAVLSLNMELKF